MREYDQIAGWYTAVRSPEVGLPDVAALSRALPPVARVLDLGCGDGVPISRFLLQQGFDLVGLDSSAEMIAHYRARFPAVPTRHERAQDADFAPGSFDAVVAWGVLFHLADAEQAAVIGKVAGWLKPGGWFLFTSGEEEDTTDGTMNGVAFRYRSLGSGTYRRLLEEAGMRWVEAHADPGENYVYVAQKEGVHDA